MVDSGNRAGKEHEMEPITIEDHQGFTDEFIKEYLTDGMGAISKHEIDLLVMNLLMKYGSLSRKSNHELSILLQIPESRIKRLRYEARLKYPPDPDYIRREFLFVLARSQFGLDNKEEAKIDRMKIIFVMEDDYLRYAIQGRLKEEGMFADTSFNSEIVKIECGSLVSIIRELYDEKTSQDFMEGFKTLNQPNDDGEINTFKDLMINFLLDTGKSILSAVLLAELKTRLGII
jgi:hypothetical protein